MNLRIAKGKVPVDMGNQYIFLDFPTLDDFCQLYDNYTRPDKRVLYWEMMKERVNGKTLKEVSQLFGVSRERVRAVEAKFIRLLRLKYSADTLGSVA